jgi:hypothetical protein
MDRVEAKGSRSRSSMTIPRPCQVFRATGLEPSPACQRHRRSRVPQQGPPMKHPISPATFLIGSMTLVAATGALMLQAPKPLAAATPRRGRSARRLCRRAGQMPAPTSARARPPTSRRDFKRQGRGEGDRLKRPCGGVGAAVSGRPQTDMSVLYRKIPDVTNQRCPPTLWETRSPPPVA